MPHAIDATFMEAARGSARGLTGTAQDYDSLLDLVGTARIVLLGEASHGTHEFYHERAQITERLVVEKGFTAVAAEADDVVCAITPEPFHAVGLWYEDFTQTTDDEVRDLLARAAMATQTA